ncbi:MAG: conjugal transfer protein TraG [Desulfobacterales bacterium]|nr:conjugal transfer protein TraG [Desulfobacterales bacterium]
MNKIITIIFILLIPVSAFAVAPDFLKVYHTHGDLYPLTTSIKRIALICTDPGYIVIYAITMAVSMALYVFSGSLKVALKKESALVQYGMALMLGGSGYVVYDTLIDQTTDLTIWDKTINQQIMVPDVPDGLVYMLSGTNYIKRAVITMVEKTSNWDGFEKMPGGINFKILQEMYSIKNDIWLGDDGENQKINIRNYISQCVQRDQNMGITTLGEIKRNTDFKPILEKAAVGSWPAEFWDYTPTSCKDLWTSINEYLINLTFDNLHVADFEKKKCNSVGNIFNIEDANSPDRIVCHEMANNSLTNYIVGSSFTTNQALLQLLIAKQFYKVQKEDTFEDAAVMQGVSEYGKSNIVSGLITQEFMQHFKNAFFLSILIIVPFLVPLFTTQLGRSVIGLVVGLFIFFTLVDIMEVVMHEQALDHAVAVLGELRDGMMGTRAFLTFESDSAKAYAVFANYKMYAFVASGIVAGSISKFAGSFGRIAMIEGGKFNAAAAAGKSRTMDPGSRQSFTKSLENVGPTEAITNMPGAYQRASNANYMQEMVRQKGSEKTISNYGMNNTVKGLSDNTSHQNASRIENATAKNNLSGGNIPGYSKTVEGANVANELGKSEAQKMAADKHYDGNQHKMKQQSSLFDENKKAVETKQIANQSDVYGLAERSGFKGTQEDFKNTMNSYNVSQKSNDNLINTYMGGNKEKAMEAIQDFKNIEAFKDEIAASKGINYEDVTTEDINSYYSKNYGYQGDDVEQDIGKLSRNQENIENIDKKMNGNAEEINEVYNDPSKLETANIQSSSETLGRQKGNEIIGKNVLNNIDDDSQREASSREAYQKQIESLSTDFQNLLQTGTQVPQEKINQFLQDDVGRQVLNEFSAKGMSVPVTDQDMADNIQRLTGSEQSIKPGSTLNAKFGFDEKGNTTLSLVDSKKGLSQEIKDLSKTDKSNTSVDGTSRKIMSGEEYTGALNATRTKNEDMTKMMDQIYNSKDKSSAVKNFSRDLTNDLDLFYKETGTDQGKTSMSLSAGIKALVKGGFSAFGSEVSTSISGGANVGVSRDNIETTISNLNYGILSRIGETALKETNADSNGFMTEAEKSEMFIQKSSSMYKKYVDYADHYAKNHDKENFGSDIIVKDAAKLFKKLGGRDVQGINKTNDNLGNL